MTHQSLTDSFLEFLDGASVQQLQLYFASSLFVIVLYNCLPGFSSIVWWFQMILENLGIGYALKWVSGSSEQSASGSDSGKSRGVRTRAAQLALKNAGDESAETRQYYPGLVNISGTYCFMNSTLQAMSSLTYLQPYLNAIQEKAELWDVETPVIDTLKDTLQALNEPSSSTTSFRPIPMINTLSAPDSSGKRSHLFSSRDHQDAQELFQLLSSLMKTEALNVDKEEARDRGLGEALMSTSDRMSRSLMMSKSNGSIGDSIGGERSWEVGKNVFEGLTANRRSCGECGYTEAVMHFTFDNITLPVPQTSNCTLDDCIKDYTKLEVLTDCICRKCSLVATHRKLASEAERLSAPSPDGASTAKKKRARDARKLEARVREALDSGRIEDDIKGVHMEKVFSRYSTKQAMIARPPPVLALHLNRSMYFGYAGKNPCRVAFPELLDLTPYSTSGELSTSPSAPISPAVAPINRSTTPTPTTLSTPRVLYRLAAVVSHYGAHSYGHYVAFRRKPRPTSASPDRFAPPKLQCPFGCECDDCIALGPVRDQPHGSKAPQYGGWLRISDDNVQEVGIGSVLAESAGTFMLYYERVVGCPSALAVSRSRRSSEETIRPPEESLKKRMNGSIANGNSQYLNGPRLVRSVYARSSRRGSATPLSPKPMTPKALPRFLTENGNLSDTEVDPCAIPLPSSPQPTLASLATNGFARQNGSTPHDTPVIHINERKPLPSHTTQLQSDLLELSQSGQTANHVHSNGNGHGNGASTSPSSSVSGKRKSGSRKHGHRTKGSHTSPTRRANSPISPARTVDLRA